MNETKASSRSPPHQQASNTPSISTGKENAPATHGQGNRKGTIHAHQSHRPFYQCRNLNPPQGNGTAADLPHHHAEGTTGKGRARALCGQIIKRDDSLRLGKPKGHSRYVVCPLCDLARMELISKFEQLVQPDNQ